MKLYEILGLIDVNGNQVINVCWRDGDTNVSYFDYDNSDFSVDEKYAEAEVEGIELSVDKWLRPRIEIIIEKVKTNKRITVHFEIPTHLVYLEEDVEIEFEDDEDDNEIEERIEEEFEEWLDNTLDDLRGYAEREIVNTEEY